MVNLEDIKDRVAGKLVPKFFRLHGKVGELFLAQADKEKLRETEMVEKMILFYMNRGGPKARMR